MLNRSITKDAFTCASCHAPQDRGIVPFEDVGHSPDDVRALRALDWQALLAGG